VIQQLETLIVSCPPTTRRRIAIHVLLWSIVLMIANVAAYLTHLIDEPALILITLMLSWLALTITAMDVVMTTDVRVNEEDPDDQAQR
jgi:uncharacterized membrane protein